MVYASVLTIHNLEEGDLFRKIQYLEHFLDGGVVRYLDLLLVRPEIPQGRKEFDKDSHGRIIPNIENPSVIATTTRSPLGENGRWG